MFMDGVSVAYLNSPQLVAAVQRFFGVLPQGFEDCNNDESDGHSSPRNSHSPNLANQELLSVSKEVQKKYVVNNKFWYYAFLFCTYLGDEIFYAAFFSFMFWNVDVVVSRKMVFIWCISLSAGQALKDFIRWPRPACPPVYCLQQKWSEEYGMPSTHAVISVTVPFSILFYSIQRYQFDTVLGFSIALFYCFMICLSRIYLGMHSLLDILAGLAFGIACLHLFHPLPTYLDQFLLTSVWSPIVLISFSCLCIILYPSSIYPVTRKETTEVVGASVGLYVGMWACYHAIPIKALHPLGRYALALPSFKIIASSIQRMFIGVAILFIFRMLFKTAYLFIINVLTSINRNFSKESVLSKLSLCYSYSLFFLIGFNITFIMPTLFTYFKIGRPTYFSEIFPYKP